MTVLDALIWVRENVDPGLAFRYSCRSANACKECVAVVNGKKTYLCTYPARGEVLVEPLPHRPLLRDVAVRMGGAEPAPRASGRADGRPAGADG